VCSGDDIGLSADGSRVVIRSDETNLGAGDTDFTFDVYV
jgi:hypothetical protein